MNDRLLQAPENRNVIEDLHFQMRPTAVSFQEIRGSSFVTKISVQMKILGTIILGGCYNKIFSEYKEVLNLYVRCQPPRISKEYHHFLMPENNILSSLLLISCRRLKKDLKIVITTTC